MSKLLTFEFDEANELLEVHGNNEGLLFLMEKLRDLIKMKESNHTHLMIPSWGGNELSEQRQCESNKLIPHTKIYIWKDDLNT